jgi:lysophospholipase L1-like esterase
MKIHALLSFVLLMTGVFCTTACAQHQPTRAPGPLQIMPLGDSITQGIFGGGYRNKLCELLTNAGYDFRFIGTQAVNSTPLLVDSGNDHHEGHGGYALSHLLNNIDGGTSNGGHWIDGLPGTRPAVYPDIILLMIGTNDLGSHLREVEPTLEDYDTFLDKLAAMRPDAFILVATLIPYTGSQEKYRLREQHQLEFNAALPALVKRHQAAGQHVGLVDMRPAVKPEHISKDDVHPTQEGYDTIAAVWFEALQRLPVMKFSRGPTTTKDS